MQNLRLNISLLSDWLNIKEDPLIIAGPCSAETEEQVISTATQIANLQRVSIFRAGIWKPRTRPGSFEGVGNVGLKWLARVKKETGMLTSVEVAKREHVEQALEHGVDVLWIGARTTGNPFSVQEIADALKGIDVPVLVKNPIYPDIQLWVGALERINRSGITKLVAVHRGFYASEKGIYRNTPQWEIPIELKIHFPDLPIICDPSHICGKKELLLPVAQKAIDLNMVGLMIETHIHPASSLSDPFQQITPAELKQFLENISYKRQHSENPVFDFKLKELRDIVDEIDDELIRGLARRMEIVEKIGEYKRENNVTILQLERWFEILRTRTNKAQLMGLRVSFIKKILQLVHKESIHKQAEVMSLQDKFA